MINYNEQNETIKAIIDDLTEQYAEDMREYPLTWVECAYNRALMINLDEYEKRMERYKHESK